MSKTKKLFTASLGYFGDMILRLRDTRNRLLQEVNAMRNGIELGQENCDAVYEELRAQRDAARARYEEILANIDEAIELIDYRSPFGLMFVEALKGVILKENVGAVDQDARLRALVERISKQTPEMPDHWTSCSQCRDNIDAALEVLEENTTPAIKER